MLNFFRRICPFPFRSGNIYESCCLQSNCHLQLHFFLQSWTIRKNGSSSTAGVMRTRYDTNPNNTFYHKANPSKKLPWIWRHQVSFLQKKWCHLIIPDLLGRFHKNKWPNLPRKKKNSDAFSETTLEFLVVAATFWMILAGRNLMDFHPSLKWQVVSIGWCESQIFTNRKWVGNHQTSIHPSNQIWLFWCKKLYPHLPTNSYLSNAASQASNLMDEKGQSPKLHPFNLCWL